MLAAIPLGLGLAAAAADSTPRTSARRTTPSGSRSTPGSIERIQGETRQALSAQGAARRRADGVDFSYGAGSDNIDALSSLATRPLSRSAPPPAGAEWIGKAQEAWRGGRDDDAAEYLRRASQAGSAGATRALGSAYAEGVGVAQNAATAIGWYRQARRWAIPRRSCSSDVPTRSGSAPRWTCARRSTGSPRRRAGRAPGSEANAASRQRVSSSLEVQLASLERCEKTGVCDASAGAVTPAADRP